MYTNLEHLSSEEQSWLKKRYYEGEPVYQLLKEYDLQIAPSKFYKLLPPEPIEKYGCSTCKVHLVVENLPRDKQHQKWDPREYFCPVCGRRPFAENYGWISFPLLSKTEIAEKRKRIEKHYSKAVPVAYTDLSFAQKIFTATLCKALLSKDQKSIYPHFGSKAVLASTKELRDKIYDELIKCNAIVVSPESDLAAFDIDSKRFPRKYDKEKVTYLLNLIMPPNDKSIFDIINCPDDCIEVNEEERLNLWKEIAVGECISYLQYRFRKVGFDFFPGEKTRLVFMKLLESFSVSQIYFIIWRNVNDTSRWYLEGKVSRPRAANAVIGACERYGENAIIYGREIPRYYRPVDCPRSILTQYFYSKILGLGNRADEICPRLNWK